MTYIVRFCGDPQLGILEKKAPKTHIVHEVMPVQGELRPVGGVQRWPKDQCGIATEMTVDLLAEYRRLARSYRLAWEELRVSQEEAERGLESLPGCFVSPSRVTTRKKAAHRVARELCQPRRTAGLCI